MDQNCITRRQKHSNPWAYNKNFQFIDNNCYFLISKLYSYIVTKLWCEKFQAIVTYWKTPKIEIQTKNNAENYTGLNEGNEMGFIRRKFNHYNFIQ